MASCTSTAWTLAQATRSSSAAQPAEPGFLPVAFERFSRAGRAPDGAGLGLALVRAVAEAHGGAAEAGTSPDGGADVWLSLPRAPAPERPRTPVGV